MSGRGRPGDTDRGRGRPEDRSFEERVAMALAEASSRQDEARSAFLAWLRSADPEIARAVEARLAGRPAAD